MKDNKLKVVPTKNYIILGIIVLVTCFLVYYLYMWYDAYQDTLLNRPILDKYMEVINYNELDNYLIENGNTIIYVSTLENEKIRDFEKKFRELFRKNSINQDILYMDITKELNDKKIKSKLLNKYSDSILNVPIIMVYDDGYLKDVYSIKESNYELDKLQKFINEIKFAEEDDLID